MKKLTGDFDNGLGAALIGEHSLASFLSEKSPEGISGLFQQYRPRGDTRSACAVWQLVTITQRKFIGSPVRRQLLYPLV
jgi:hypothetical protein